MRSLRTVFLLLTLAPLSHLAAQPFFTELNGFRLKQYRETALKEFGEPYKSGKHSDGVEYEAFLIKPDGSIYMVFDYAAKQNDIILNIQITGTDSTFDPGFRGLRFGLRAVEVEKQLGRPTEKISVGEYGTRWEYDKSNFSVEINTENKLSSIKIRDISEEIYPIPDVKKIPRFGDVLKILSSGSNIEMAKLLAPDMELYVNGQTTYFQKSIKNEIATDYSKIFSTIRELAKELAKVNFKNQAEYEENGRLTLGQAPKHVMKFKTAGKVKEIVFKYEWGEFLVWEFDAGRGDASNWDLYKPRTMDEIVTTIIQPFLTKPDVAITNAEKKPDIVLSYDSYQSRVKVIYTGESRPISNRRKETIETWLRVLGRPKELLDLFEVEYLFIEDKKEFWLPVQKQIAVYFPKELKKNDSVTLFLVWLGGRYETAGVDNIFLVNDFEK